MPGDLGGLSVNFVHSAIYQSKPVTRIAGDVRLQTKSE